MTCLCPWIARRTGQTEEQLNKPETQTNEQTEAWANEHPSERTDSRMTELTIKRSTEAERSPAKTNEQETEWANPRN